MLFHYRYDELDFSYMLKLFLKTLFKNPCDYIIMKVGQITCVWDKKGPRII